MDLVPERAESLRKMYACSATTTTNELSTPRTSDEVVGLAVNAQPSDMVRMRGNTVPDAFAALSESALKEEILSARGMNVQRSNRWETAEWWKRSGGFLPWTCKAEGSCFLGFERAGKGGSVALARASVASKNSTEMNKDSFRKPETLVQIH